MNKGILLGIIIVVVFSTGEILLINEMVTGDHECIDRSKGIMIDDCFILDCIKRFYPLSIIMSVPGFFLMNFGIMIIIVTREKKEE